ncbi:MAG: hypothetical protein JW827_10640 [Spirochaetes bacterium]|nr:hypothetical protein [Spirochaetota bacterium]
MKFSKKVQGRVIGILVALGIILYLLHRYLGFEKIKSSHNVLFPVIIKNGAFICVVVIFFFVLAGIIREKVLANWLYKDIQRSMEKITLEGICRMYKLDQKSLECFGYDDEMNKEDAMGLIKEHLIK